MCCSLYPQCWRQQLGTARLLPLRWQGPRLWHPPCWNALGEQCLQLCVRCECPRACLPIRLSRSRVLSTLPKFLLPPTPLSKSHHAPHVCPHCSRACRPPAGSRQQQGVAVGVLSDVAAILRLGRPVVVTALMDLSRLLEAARQQLEGGPAWHSGGRASKASGRHCRHVERCPCCRLCVRVSRRGGPVSQPLPARDLERSTLRLAVTHPMQEARRLQRRLVAAERKLLFFLSWANEQLPEVYSMLALAVGGELEKHSAVLAEQADGGSSGGLAGAVGGGVAQLSAAARQTPRPPAGPLVEEL